MLYLRKATALLICLNVKNEVEGEVKQCKVFIALQNLLAGIQTENSPQLKKNWSV